MDDTSRDDKRSSANSISLSFPLYVEEHSYAMSADSLALDGLAGVAIGHGLSKEASC